MLSFDDNSSELSANYQPPVDKPDTHNSRLESLKENPRKARLSITGNAPVGLKRL